MLRLADATDRSFVTSCCFSADLCPLLYTARRSGRLNVWDMATAALVHSIHVHDGCEGMLDVSVSEQCVATCGMDHAVVLMRRADLSVLASFSVDDIACRLLLDGCAACDACRR